MKTTAAKVAAIAAIALAAAFLASPWVMAATSTTSTATTSTSSTVSSSSTAINQYQSCLQARGLRGGTGTSAWPGTPGHELGFPNATSLTVGQTITVTSSEGSYYVLGNSGNNGSASGTITFTVTSKLSEGYTLSITSGNIVVGGTSYTISSGSAQTGPSANIISGQGTTSPTGQFLLQGFASGSFAGTNGQLHLDFEAGSTEFAVALTGAIQS